jgi:hypothetical protein
VNPRESFHAEFLFQMVHEKQDDERHASAIKHYTRIEQDIVQRDSKESNVA